MSQCEMKNRDLFKILIATCISALPVNSFGAIHFSQATLFPAFITYFSTSYSVSASSPKKRGPASINRAATSLVAPSKIFYSEDGKSLSPELIANFNLVKFNYKPVDMTQMIPLNMQPSDNSSQVFSQVADRTMTSIWNSEAVRGSALGQAATEVEKQMKAQVVMGGNSPESIQHKLNFNMQAFQATAQVQYTGFTNANLKYKVTERKLGLEVFEHMTGNKDLVVSHTITSLDRLSEVSLRWNF